MNLIEKITRWLNYEVDQEIDLQDMVQHSPEYHRKAKPKLRQTNHEFIEVPTITNEGDEN